MITHLIDGCCRVYLCLCMYTKQHGDPNYSEKNHHWPEWRRRHIVRVKQQLYSLQQQSDDNDNTSATEKTCSTTDETTCSEQQQQQSSDSAIDDTFKDDDAVVSNTEVLTKAKAKSKVMQSSYPGMYMYYYTYKLIYINTYTLQCARCEESAMVVNLM
jgi:hypothetical protein